MLEGLHAAAAGMAAQQARMDALAEDVANAVYLLCLPEAAMINGHTLVVDGGFCISG